MSWCKGTMKSTQTPKYTVLDHGVCYKCCCDWDDWRCGRVLDRNDGIMVWGIKCEDKAWQGDGTFPCPVIRSNILAVREHMEFPDKCMYLAEQIIMSKHYHTLAAVRKAWRVAKNKREAMIGPESKE